MDPIKPGDEQRPEAASPPEPALAPEPAAQDVRQRIEARALELFAQKGYHGTAVREILEAAGATAPTLYYHFGSKEGLFRELLRQLVQRMRSRVEAAGQVDGIRAQLLAVFRGHVQELLEHPEEIGFFHRVVIGQLQHGEATDPLVKGHLGGEMLRPLLEEAVRRGELRAARPELLVNALVGAMGIYVARRLMDCACKQAAGQTDPAPRQATEEGLAAAFRDVERIIDIFLAGSAASSVKEQR